MPAARLIAEGGRDLVQNATATFPPPQFVAEAPARPQIMESYENAHQKHGNLDNQTDNLWHPQSGLNAQPANDQQAQKEYS